MNWKNVGGGTPVIRIVKASIVKALIMLRRVVATIVLTEVEDGNEATAQILKEAATVPAHDGVARSPRMKMTVIEAVRAEVEAIAKVEVPQHKDRKRIGRNEMTMNAEHEVLQEVKVARSRF
jgi:hypothetical protein